MIKMQRFKKLPQSASFQKSFYWRKMADERDLFQELIEQGPGEAAQAASDLAARTAQAAEDDRRETEEIVGQLASMVQEQAAPAAASQSLSEDTGEPSKVIPIKPSVADSGVWRKTTTSRSRKLRAAA